MSRPIVKHETKRLLLKPTGIEDAPFILSLLNTPSWIENIGDRNVHSITAASKYIQEKMLPNYEKHGYGNYIVIRKIDKVKMGTSGIYARPNVEDVDIGFAMLPDYMGKGYSYEAASKLMELAKAEFGLKKITALTTRNNIASQNLIKKLGMKYLKDIRLENDPEVLMQFGMEL